MTLRKTWGPCLRIVPRVERALYSLYLACGDAPLPAHEGPDPLLPCSRSLTSQFHQLRASLWFALLKGKPKITIVSTHKTSFPITIWATSRLHLDTGEA